MTARSHTRLRRNRKRRAREALRRWEARTGRKALHRSRRPMLAERLEEDQ